MYHIYQWDELKELEAKIYAVGITKIIYYKIIT